MDAGLGEGGLVFMGGEKGATLSSSIHRVNERKSAKQRLESSTDDASARTSQGCRAGDAVGPQPARHVAIFLSQRS